MWALALLACALGPHAEPDAVAEVSDEAPAITAVTWACDVDAATWTFGATTARWTGGGRVWMTRGGDPAEAHGLSSTVAAADGSADTLALTLSVVADWRYASSGSSTRFRCDQEPDLSFMVTIYAPSTGDVADCRTWGAEPGVWASVDGAYPCETELALPSDTGDTGDTGAAAR